MVVGKTSNLVEGFQDITVDDGLLMSNIKQAIKYTTLKQQMANPIGNEGKTINPTPTMSSMGSGTMSAGMMPAVPTGMIPTMPAGMMPTVPTGMIPTMQADMMKPMPNQTVATTTTQPATMSKFANTPNAKRRSIAHFKNVKNEVENVKHKEEEESNDEEDNDNEEFENGDDGEISEEEEGSDDKVESFANQNIEAFQGSKIIEGGTMKNVLLALLITFLSYIVAFVAMRNLLPITEWFPQLRKFKNFIYWGLLFLVVYLCLEIF